MYALCGVGLVFIREKGGREGKRKGGRRAERRGIP
jgi:hypothetical protein